MSEQTLKATESHKKSKPKVPIDLIITFLSIIFLFVYVLIYYFYNEMLAMYTYTRNAIVNLHTRVARSLIQPRLRLNSFFGIPHQKIYPPHYHLSIQKERDIICFDNCYQTLTQMKSVSKYVMEPKHFLAPLRKWDLWSLDWALRTRLDDIHYLAIRNVCVTLLQNILLWLERRVENASSAHEKKNHKERLNEKVQETFAALFQTGNWIIQEEQKKNFSLNFGWSSFLEEERLQIQPMYPIEIKADQEWDGYLPVKPIEQLARVQMVLTWMMWKYTPDHYVGYCGEKVYEERRHFFEKILSDILFLDQLQFDHTPLLKLMVEYVVF